MLCVALSPKENIMTLRNVLSHWAVQTHVISVRGLLSFLPLANPSDLFTALCGYSTNGKKKVAAVAALAPLHVVVGADGAAVILLSL